MITGSEYLWSKEEYTYSTAGNFLPNIHWYLHDDAGGDADRPAMIVVPGGGYTIVSPTEGEIVALKFFEMGYNAFVVTYTINMTGQTPLKFQPLKDLSAAVTYVRDHAADMHTIKDQVTVCGFSAGAHLTGSLAVHHDAPEIHEAGRKCSNNRPDAVILSYPVITAGEYAHRGSFTALLGENASDEELEYMSLEKQVTPDMPPCFLWQTVTDETVPVENSYLMAEACKKNSVKFEHHVFSEGPHGSSLADETWASGAYGGLYTMEQTFEALQAMLDAGMPLPEPFHMFAIPEGVRLPDMAVSAVNTGFKQERSWPALTVWPVLADAFITSCFKTIRES